MIKKCHLSMNDIDKMYPKYRQSLMVSATKQASDVTSLRSKGYFNKLRDFLASDDIIAEDAVLKYAKCTLISIALSL